MEEGPTEVLLDRPFHPYTRALWDSRVSRGTHYTRDSLVLIGGAPPDPQSPEPGCPFAPRCGRVQSDCRVSVPPLVGSDRVLRCFHPLGEA
jgi:oligopeptide/dipeptide ABC transporter ATP-binding protein